MLRYDKISATLFFNEKMSKFFSCFNCLYSIVKFLWRKHLLAKCYCMHVSEGVLIACAIAWSCGVVRFEEIPVLRARFFAKFRWSRFSKISWPAKATPGVFKFSYLRNYCRYFLYICLIKSMKTTLSENKMRFKVVQKMRDQLGVSTNFWLSRVYICSLNIFYCHIYRQTGQATNSYNISYGPSQKIALHGILAPPTGFITRWTSKN